jgi:hypothetical protein
MPLLFAYVKWEGHLDYNRLCSNLISRINKGNSAGVKVVNTP